VIGGRGLNAASEEERVRTVLEEFYNFTGGPEWYSKCIAPEHGCWLDPATPYCQWLGLTCQPSSYSPPPVSSPRRLLIIHFFLLLSFLCAGRVDNSTLLSISLVRNNLHGSLGSIDFGALNATLLSLNLDHNRLEGHVPSSLCNVGALTQLRLSNNNLNGTLPTCFNSSKQLVRLVGYMNTY
jgi:hypothetical protein